MSEDNKNNQPALTDEIEDKRKQIVSDSIDSLPIVADILNTLSKSLPKNLYYHSKSHTDDVIREAVLFGLVDGLPIDSMRLLAVAAAFHDAGFIESPVDNERIGAAMARRAMEKDSTFSQEEIDLVCQMILDTRLVETRGGLRQVPTTDLSRYLLDADLSNFGREDFFEKAEMQRRELGYDRELFMRKTFELINNHRWLTNAALKLRQEEKASNIAKLRVILQSNDSELGLTTLELGVERLAFLAKLPLLLNSSLKTQKIIDIAIEHLRSRIGADAATVFLLEEGAQELTFWASKGGEGSRLIGLKMPAGKGIVGWVIENRESLLVQDVAADSRFFPTIDKEGQGFITRNLICVPLVVRGNTPIGAIQVLNKSGGENFSDDDLVFVEQFAHQAGLAIDNARLHEALREKNKKLEIIDRRKNDIIQVISHEFRTPLNVIQTSAELIASGYLKDDAAVKDVTGALTRGVDKLTKLIAQIRNISLVTEDKFEFEQEKVEVKDLIDHSLAAFKEGAKTRSISLESALPANAGKVLCDYSLIMVVMNNLLSNAIRFTKDGGKVTVNVTRASGFVTISVADNGIGIAEQELPLIFEKFYEVGDSLNHSSGELGFMSGGLGLGLATAKSILHAHGSSLEVKSVLGQGSEFIFNLHAE